MAQDPAAPVEMTQTRGRADVDDTAQIWAEATAARDGNDQVPGLDVSRPVIQAILDRSGRAFLVVARTGGIPVGFAAVAPLSGPDQAAAEIAYFGVRPGSWGQGIGAKLLRHLRSRLTSAGFTHAELDVYVENVRAAVLYQRLGWLPQGDPRPHCRTGRPEQRYVLRL